MKAAMIVLTILSTGRTDENLLLDMTYVFERIIDEIVPDFQDAIESAEFSQGDLCPLEK